MGRFGVAGRMSPALHVAPNPHAVGATTALVVAEDFAFQVEPEDLTRRKCAHSIGGISQLVLRANVMGIQYVIMKRDVSSLALDEL